MLASTGCGCPFRRLRQIARSSGQSSDSGGLWISGAIDRTFIRDEAWLFLTMGMMFERMYRGLLVIKHRLPILLEHPADIDIPIHHARVRGVLRTLASLENYRRVYGADLNPDQVARFLLFDEHTPHSVRACLGRMEQAINILEAGTGMSEAGRLIGRLSSRPQHEENDLMALDDLGGGLFRTRGIRD